MRVLFICLLLGSSVSLSAQAAPSSPTDAFPEASEPTSPRLADIAERLSRLSTTLSSEVDASRIDLAELRSSLEESRTALESCRSSLDEALDKARRRDLELWIWRGAAALGAAAALYFAFSD
jgi:ABC-type transporter Mla subunit MlaD